MSVRFLGLYPVFKKKARRGAQCMRRPKGAALALASAPDGEAVEHPQGFPVHHWLLYGGFPKYIELLNFIIHFRLGLSLK